VKVVAELGQIDPSQIVIMYIKRSF